MSNGFGLIIMDTWIINGCGKLFRDPRIRDRHIRGKGLPGYPFRLAMPAERNQIDKNYKFDDDHAL